MASGGPSLKTRSGRFTAAASGGEGNMAASHPELHRLRDSIDNIDAALIHLLAERFKCTQAVGEFKAKCLHLLDEVAQRRIPLVITKRGKPVAKLVPIEEKPVDIYGCMAGTGRILGDIVSPLDDWGNADAENVLGEGEEL